MLRILRLLGLATVVGVLLGLAVACDHGPVVRVQNSSDEVVVVYEDGNPSSLVAPDTTREFWVPKFEGTHVFEIRVLEGGQILASRSFTWEELKKEGDITIIVE